MTKKNEYKSGFENFFEALTNTPEFKAVMETWKNTISKSYKEAKKTIDNIDFQEIINDVKNIENDLKKDDFKELSKKEFEELKKQNEWILKAGEIMDR